MTMSPTNRSTTVQRVPTLTAANVLSRLRVRLARRIDRHVRGALARHAMAEVDDS